MQNKEANLQSVVAVTVVIDLSRLVTPHTEDHLLHWPVLSSCGYGVCQWCILDKLDLHALYESLRMKVYKVMHVDNHTSAVYKVSQLSHTNSQGL